MDPYSVLGISSSASDDEVKQAYKRLAKKYHPDLNPGDKTAEAKMKEVNAAYDEITAIRSGKQTYSSARSQYGSASGDPYGRQYYGGYTSYGKTYRQAQDEWTRYASSVNSDDDPFSSKRVVISFFPIFKLIRGIFIFLFLQAILSFLLRSCSMLSPYQYNDKQPPQKAQTRITEIYEADV